MISLLKRLLGVKQSNKNADTLGLYDPLLGVVGPKTGHAHFRGGYKIWPSASELPESKFTLMCLGNSTSLWPDSAWSLELGKLLRVDGIPVTIFNGAGKGSTSSQDVLRLVRDVSGIQPSLVISLSGICDIGQLLNAKDYAFSHKYVRRAMTHLQDGKQVSGVVFGYPDKLSPGQVWCRNQRFAAALAKEQGVPILSFLQAVQGFGNYPQSDEEKTLFSTKGKVVLKSANKPYMDCVIEFYEEVRSIIKNSPEQYKHVVDFTDVFDDCPQAYRDHRHQSPKGVKHLAEKMLPIVRAKLLENSKSFEKFSAASAEVKQVL